MNHNDLLSLEGMQSDTVDIYNSIASSYVARTLSADMSHFYDKVQSKFPHGATLLDVGSGSGRDALALAKRGFAVDILEPAIKLLEDFMSRAPGFKGKAHHASVESAKLTEQHYDGIYACASLLHVKPENWATALQNLHQASKPGGRLYLSVKKCASGHDSEGRWFTGFDSAMALQEMVELSSNWKLDDVELTSDSLGRDTLWFEAWFKA